MQEVVYFGSVSDNADVLSNTMQEMVYFGSVSDNDDVQDVLVNGAGAVGRWNPDIMSGKAQKVWYHHNVRHYVIITSDMHTNTLKWWARGWLLERMVACCLGYTHRSLQCCLCSALGALERCTAFKDVFFSFTLLSSFPSLDGAM